MRTFALVGTTGTGKSFHCIELARENNIEGIVDDGLLISRGRILAGKSAKHETNKIASVKCAIFESGDHAAEVRAAINANALKSILVIGTSERMVRLIAQRLELPPFERIFLIEEIATPEEIKTASYMRNVQGKHIIPAPVFEVKKQFSGYFLKSIMPGKRGQAPEKTVMRPTYSYMGSFKIAPRVISDICRIEISAIPEITKVYKIQSVPDFEGRLEISIELALQYPCNIPQISSKIQQRLSEAVEYSTSIIAKDINITIKTLSV